MIGGLHDKEYYSKLAVFSNSHFVPVRHYSSDEEMVQGLDRVRASASPVCVRYAGALAASASWLGWEANT